MSKDCRNKWCGFVCATKKSDLISAPAAQGKLSEASQAYSFHKYTMANRLLLYSICDVLSITYPHINQYLANQAYFLRELEVIDEFDDIDPVEEDEFLETWNKFKE